MEQNREPRIKPRPLVNYYLTKEAIACNGIKTVSSINGDGKTGQVHAKNETRPPTYTINQKKLKIDKIFKHKLQHNKNPRGKQRQ